MKCILFYFGILHPKQLILYTFLHGLAVNKTDGWRDAKDAESWHVAIFNAESQGGLASWDESDEKWIIPRLDLAGNNLVKSIPTSIEGAFRPETDYSRLNDSGRRCRHDNILCLDLDRPGSISNKNIDTNLIDMNIDGDLNYTDSRKSPYLCLTKERKHGKANRNHGRHMSRLNPVPY